MKPLVPSRALNENLSYWGFEPKLSESASYIKLAAFYWPACQCAPSKQKQASGRRLGLMPPFAEPVMLFWRNHLNADVCAPPQKAAQRMAQSNIAHLKLANHIWWNHGAYYSAGILERSLVCCRGFNDFPQLAWSQILNSAAVSYTLSMPRNAYWQSSTKLKPTLLQR